MYIKHVFISKYLRFYGHINNEISKKVQFINEAIKLTVGWIFNLSNFFRSTDETTITFSLLQQKILPLITIGGDNLKLKRDFKKFWETKNAKKKTAKE